MAQNAANDFLYGPDEPKATNLGPRMGARDRQDESDEADRDLRDVSRHVGNQLPEAGPDGRGAEFDRNATSFPVDSTRIGLTDLKGRERQGRDVSKPVLEPRPNYVGPSGAGTGSVLPNTALSEDKIVGPEDLDS